MADKGLYIHNGSGWVLQNNGHATRQGGYGEAEIFAHNGGGWEKIYPREQSFSADTGNNGGFSMRTVSQNYGTYYKEGVAHQGTTSGPEGKPRRKNWTNVVE